MGGGALSRQPMRRPSTGRSPRGRGSLIVVPRARFTIGSIPAWAGEPVPTRVLFDLVEVDPRVGGGACRGDEVFRVGGGRSPRGRGSRECLRRLTQRWGSIPAWAGEPARGVGLGRGRAVDPRVGGGATEHSRGRERGSGRSPRGRGSRRVLRRGWMAGGSIPAWAGEPRCRTLHATTSQVDPRVGGGARLPGDGDLRVRGRSPRGRGSHDDAAPAIGRRGAIPAWAGEPRPRGRRCPAPRVDPRVGGGARNRGRYSGYALGRSPRGRGSRALRVGRSRDDGSIPAWAGEPRRGSPDRRALRVDPRVGGGASRPTPGPGAWSGRSPRGRGSRDRAAGARARPGSIPAWAGEPRRSSCTRRACRVDPRVGGGASADGRPACRASGRSPRGRGSPRDIRHPVRRLRSIPAWAGEP